MKYFIGIDNGISGAVATLHPDGKVLSWHAMPVQSSRKGNEVDIVAIYNDLWRQKTIVRAWGAELVVVIEEPGGAQSYKAAVSMAASFHSLRAAIEILRLRYHRITPQSWQKQLLHCKAGDSKPAAAALARRLWPKERWLNTARCTTPNNGAIDAALIAEYGRRNDL